MYILQNGLTKYFREIDKNQNVIIVDNACRSMLFKDKIQAIRFKEVLQNSYKYNFVIIEI